MKLLSLLIFCVLLIMLVSCHNAPSTELLIGSWKMMEDSVRPSPIFSHGNRSGYYEFINDSLVDTKRRYYALVTLETGETQHLYLGTKTKYKIEDNTLSVFDLTDRVWKSIGELKNLSVDKMTLTNEKGNEFVFLRQSYDKIITTDIDAIALSSSGCFGTCPIIDIIIEEEGNVMFYGRGYVDKLGFFEGKISKERFEQIRNEFNKAGVPQLKQYYDINHTDNETLTTTFLFKNKIINSIQDYGEAGPPELIWGYSELRYLFENIELKKMDTTNAAFYLSLNYYAFIMGNKRCVLSQSEYFLLWNFLRKGTLVQGKFNGLYSVGFSENMKGEKKVETISTDGRFYTFNLKKQKAVTIDIGFNFLELNPVFLNFVEPRKH